MADKTFKYNFVIDILQTGVPIQAIGARSASVNTGQAAVVNQLAATLKKVEKSFIDILNANKSYGTKTGAVINGLTRYSAAQTGMNSSLMLVVNRLGAYGVGLVALITVSKALENALNAQLEHVRNLAKTYKDAVNDGSKYFEIFRGRGTELEENIRDLSKEHTKTKDEITILNSKIKKQTRSITTGSLISAVPTLGLSLAVGAATAYFKTLGDRRKLTVAKKLAGVQEDNLKKLESLKDTLTVNERKRVELIEVLIALIRGDTEEEYRLLKKIIEDNTELSEQVKKYEISLLNARKETADAAKKEAERVKQEAETKRRTENIENLEIQLASTLKEYEKVYKLKLEQINKNSESEQEKSLRRLILLAEETERIKAKNLEIEQLKKQAAQEELLRQLNINSLQTLIAEALGQYAEAARLKAEAIDLSDSSPEEKRLKHTLLNTQEAERKQEEEDRINDSILQEKLKFYGMQKDLNKTYELEKEAILKNTKLTDEEREWKLKNLDMQMAKNIAEKNKPIQKNILSIEDLWNTFRMLGRNDKKPEEEIAKNTKAIFEILQRNSNNMNLINII